jgi:asparagine synthase (glutamine-hydrolysing)
VLQQELIANELMAGRYLVFEQAEHFSETFFRGVYKLPASHGMIIDLRSGTINTAPYYAPRRLDTWRNMKEQDAVTELRHRISQSVALRMRSDVEVGTCLSGGMDSSTLAAYAANLYSANVQRQFTGITAGSVEEAKDETAYARMVADATGISWRVCTPEPLEYSQVFPEVLKKQEEPFDSGSVVMQYFVMQLAHDAGLKVLLDGQGADELLMGYKQHLAWTIKALPALSAAKLAISSLNKYQIGWRELALLLFYHTRVEAKRNRQLARWPGLKKELVRHLKEEAAVEGRQPADLFGRQSNELYHRILPMLLRYEDKNAMAFSVETRLPFLDPDLVEFLLNIDEALKVRNGWSKYLLRKANEGLLPNEIVWRTGKGAFSAPPFLPADASKAGPVAGWLREVLGDVTTIASYERKDISFRVRSLSLWAQRLL